MNIFRTLHGAEIHPSSVGILFNIREFSYLQATAYFFFFLYKILKIHIDVFGIFAKISKHSEIYSNISEDN